MKVNNEATLGEESARPKWNHMCTDLRSFVWILRLHCCRGNPQLWLYSRCCNKLDIICVHTLWFSLSYLECASDIVHGNLAGRSDMAAAGTDAAVGRLHPPRPYPFFSLHGWSLRCWNHLHVSCHSAAERKAFPYAFKKNKTSTLS